MYRYRLYLIIILFLLLCVMMLYTSKKKECFANINIFSDNLLPYTKAPVEINTPKSEIELNLPKEIKLGTTKLGVYYDNYISDTLNNNNDDYINFVSTYNTESPENKCLEYAKYYNNNEANNPKIISFSIRKQHSDNENDTCRFNSSSSSNWLDTPNSSPTTQYLNTYCVNGNTPNDDPPYCTL
jgi:hypothetical protein